MKKIKEFWKKNWWVIIGIIVGGFFIFKLSNKPVEEPDTIIQDKDPMAEIITFGVWSPAGNKSIVGTVQSESNIDIPAELNGKIKKIFVDMGDPIQAGQALASFDVQGDMTYINYQNAINTLETVENNTKSSIASTKLTLINAENEYEQLLLQLDQSKKSTLEGLRNIISATSTIGLNILNYFDGQVGASSKYDDQFAIGRHHIGGSNQILKTKVQNDIRSFRRTYETLINRDVLFSEKPLLSTANQYLSFLKQLKIIAQNYNTLIQGTVVTSTFSNNQKQQVASLTEGKNTQADQTISQLNAQIQAVENLDQQQKNQILSAKNRIKNVKASLDLTKIQSEGQIKSAQNSVDLASSQKADLIVRAPFSGRITEKFIREGQLVSPGVNLFSIVNLDKEKKVVAFFSSEEITQLNETIKIEYGHEVIEVSKFIQGLTIDPQTQKIRVDFILPKDTNILPGKSVKILLSSDEETNMVPLSATSFEPDGTQEVLILNKDNLLERKKVEIKNDIADGVKILSGLDIGDSVIKYKNRFYSGQKVKTKN